MELVRNSFLGSNTMGSSSQSVVSSPGLNTKVPGNFSSTPDAGCGCHGQNTTPSPDFNTNVPIQTSATRDGLDGIVRFIAVAGVSDRTILATHGNSPEMNRAAAKVLRWNKLEGTQLLTVRDATVGDMHVQYITDNDISMAYLVVTSENYPQGLAFQFLGELSRNLAILHGGSAQLYSAEENTLTRTSSKFMSDLAIKYYHAQK